MSPAKKVTKKKTTTNKAAKKVKAAIKGTKKTPPAPPAKIDKKTLPKPKKNKALKSNEGKPVASGVSYSKYREMCVAYFEVQTFAYVQETCNVNFRTAQ